MQTITITLSIPSYASTYADLGAEHLTAAVEAWGDYLHDQLAARYGAEVEVETTREALIEDKIDTDGDADEVRGQMARIAEGWWALSSEERAEYGFPGDDTVTLAVDEENDGEDWWTAAREAEDCPEALRALVHGDATEATAPRSALAWCEALPGWTGGPAYAPHPLLVR
jgi:hypothetical protein